MSKRQCPETEVRGGVGDSSQNELNGLDKLMDEDVSEGSIVAAVSLGLVLEEVRNLPALNRARLSLFLIFLILTDCADMLLVSTPVLLLVLFLILHLLHKVLSGLSLDHWNGWDKALLLGVGAVVSRLVLQRDALLVVDIVVLGLVSVELVLLVNVKGFREEHGRHTDKSYE